MIALGYPFMLVPGGKLSTTTAYERIVRAQVIDALMTNQGERVMRPNYGCDVQAALFDPSDELVRRDAANLLKDRLQRLVPRCLVRSVTVELAIQPYLVHIGIVYRPSQFSTDQVLNVPIASEFVNRSIALEATGQEEFE